jgi:hypothetical protein
VTVLHAFIDLLFARYSKRDEKRWDHNRFHSLGAMVNLEPLYSVRRILAEIPINNTSIVTTLAQGDLDLSDVITIKVIHRLRVRWRHLLAGTRYQGNSGSDQKYKPRCYYHISFLYSSLLLSTQKNRPRRRGRCLRRRNDDSEHSYSNLNQ